jgi:hypothetical protein
MTRTDAIALIIGGVIVALLFGYVVLMTPGR